MTKAEIDGLVKYGVYVRVGEQLFHPDDHEIIKARARLDEMHREVEDQRRRDRFRYDS